MVSVEWQDGVIQKELTKVIAIIRIFMVQPQKWVGW